MDKKIAIQVKNVYKSFRLPHEQHNGLKQALINALKRKRGYEIQHVLDDVSFEIKKGEFVGIVGRNGSGKSTLLKLISGIYAQNEGEININGTVTSFIELGVGFNPELTGRENVFMNGALLGFSRKEMALVYDEIIEFAELERFMDQKLKNYSSGMQVRLAFSIAIQAKNDILILDEVLAVGDEAFQKKCYDYFALLKKENKTVVLVTHDMGSVQRFCTRAILINKGKVAMDDSTSNVTKAYALLNREPDAKVSKSSVNKSGAVGKGKFDVSVECYNKKGKKTRTFYPEDNILLRLKITPKQSIKGIFLGVTLQKPDGEYVYWKTTEKRKEVTELQAGKSLIIDLELDNIFGDNTYSVNIAIKSADRTKEYLLADNVTSFDVTGWGPNGWMLHPKSKFKVLEGQKK